MNFFWPSLLNFEGREMVSFPLHKCGTTVPQIVFEKKKQFFFQTMFFIVEKKLFFIKIFFFPVFFFQKFLFNEFILLLKVV